MKKTSERVLAFALAFAMAVAMVPAIPARAVGEVTYIDEYGKEQTCEDYTDLISGITTLDTGWYVVSGNVTIDERVKLKDDYNVAVNIILKDGSTLTAQKGIGVTQMNQELKIYGQSEQSGKLTATATGGDAAIGGTSGIANCAGANITINGGIINATASGVGAAIGAGGSGNQYIGSVTINGGEITAKAGNGNKVGSSSSYVDGEGGGAGIGSAGNDGGYCQGGVIINGGTVTATGGPGAAGIGGGYRSKYTSDVTIEGGAVTATGGAIYDSANNVSNTFYSFGAGIGGGAGLTDDEKVTISGGTIIAIGGKHSGFETRASGIGNKYASDKNNSPAMELNISGGIIYATSIDEKAQGNIGSWSGVIFDGADGKVYGSPEITGNIDLTVPSDIKSTGISNYTLEVPGDSTLTVGDMTIPSGGTLNVGTKEKPDAKLIVNGSVSNSGTVEVYGDVEGSISGKPNYHYQISPTTPTFTNVKYGYTQPDAGNITIKNTGKDSVTITGVALTNGENFTLVDGTAGDLANGASNDSWTIQPKDGLSPNKYTDTITVTYNVQNSEAPRTATAEVSLTVDKAESEVTPSGAESEISVNYGDSVTLSVDVKRQGADTIALASAEQDQVVFTFPKNSKTETVDVSYDDETNKDSGKASVTIEAKDVKNYFAIGPNTVKVSYGGSVNLANNEDATIKVNLSQKPLEFTFTPDPRDYEAGNTTVTGDLQMTTSLVDGDIVTANYTASVLTADAENNKEVTVEVTLDGADKNYYKAENPSNVKVTISKATLTAEQVTAPTGKDSVAYTGSAVELLNTAGTVPDGCTVKYAVKTSEEEPSDGEWKDDYTGITGQAAGKYYVYWKVDGGTNYNEYTPDSGSPITVSITKTAPKQTTAPALVESLTYTGEAQSLIKTAAVYEGGTVSYLVKKNDDTTPSASEGDWKDTSSAITGTDAGTYYVWYKVTGDENHDNVGPTQVGSGSVVISKAESTVEVGEVTGATYGNEIELTATVTGVSDKTKVTGTVQFKVDGNNLGSPVEVTNGTATLTIQSTDGTNQKALFDNSTKVTAEYAGNDNITKSTSGQKEVTVSPKTLSYTVSAESRTYNGSASINVTLATDDVLCGDKVTLSATGTLSSPNVGEYGQVKLTDIKADGEQAKYYSVESNNDSATLSQAINITKASISNVTAPTANDRTYDGKMEDLVTAPAGRDDGTMQYVLGTAEVAGSEYSNTIPQKKDAGTYYVWYKVVGDDNHNDSEPDKVEVTIAQKEVTLNWQLDGRDTFSVTYTGTAHKVTATANTGVDGESVNVTVENGMQTDVGSSYTATATALTDVEGAEVAKNYKLPEAKTQEYSIKQATPTVEVKASDNPTYGSEITLTATVTSGGITADKFGGATVQFKIGDVNFGDSVSVDGSTGMATLTIPGTDREKQHTLFGENGTVSVTADYSGNDNITQKTSSPTEVKVSQKTLKFNFKAKDKTYNENKTVEGTFDSLTEQLVNGDDVNIKSYEATTGDANVGDSKTVTVNVTELEGTDSQYYTPGEAISNAINITKADATDVVAPTGKSGLIYNGKNQVLIENAGSVKGGTMKYYVGEKGVSDQPSEDVVWKDAIDDITGKDAGTYTVWYKVVGDSNHNDTTANSINVITVEQKVVTLEWSGDTGLLYTGSAHTISATVNNKENDDDVKVEVEVKANGDETGASGATATNAGSYTAEAKQLTGTSAENYKLPETKTKTFIIGKATVDFEIDGYNTFAYDTNTHTVAVKEKDGDATKLPGVDSYSVLYTASESTNSTDGEENKTDVGAYKVWVKLSDEAFKNYQFTDGTQEKNVGTMEITRAALILNVSGSEITYGDTLSMSNLSGTATIDGGTEIKGKWEWNEDEEASSIYPTVTGSDSTTYTVKFTPTSSSAGNFTAESLSKKINITVKPFTLTPQVESVDGKTYDGDVTAQNGKLIFAEAATLANAPFNTNTPTASGEFTFTDKNVGKNKSVNVTGITISAADANNYQLKDGKDTIKSAVTSAEITAKEVVLTWSTPTEFTYNGEQQGVTVTVDTGVSGESLTAELTDNMSIDAGSYIAEATSLTDGEGGGLASNYKLPDTTTQAYTINKATVSVENITKTLTYTTQPQTVGNVTVNTNGAPTLTQDSDYSVLYTASESEGSKDGEANKTDVGTYNVWVKLSDEAYKNYMFADDAKENNVGTMTINQAALTLTIDPVTITYGDELADGLLSGKATIDGGTEITGTWAWQKQNDTYPKPSDENHNYVVVFTPEAPYKGNFETSTLQETVTITVNKKTLTPSINTVASIDQFSGETGTTGTLKLSGAVLSESPTATGTFNFDTATAEENKPVTVTEIKLEGNWGDNYELSTETLSSVTTDASIGKRVVTLEWKLNDAGNFTVIYSSQPVNVTAAVTNLVTSYPCTVTVTDGDKTDAGTYTATASLSDPNNYTLPTDGNEQQKYTIEKSVVTFTETNGTTTYDTNPHKVTLDNNTTGGAPKLEAKDYTVHYAVKGSGFEGGAMDETKAGEYDVWVQLSDETFKNYEFTGKAQTYKVGTLTVNKASLDLTVVPVTITYGDALDNAQLTGSTAKIQSEGGATIHGTWAWEKVGEYPTVANSKSTNYKVTFTPDSDYVGNFVEETLSTEITITVNKYELTPVVVASSVTGKIYNGNTDVTGGALEFENMELFNNTPFSGNEPTISGTFAYTSKDAETNTVNVSDIKFDTNGDNYSLSTTTINGAAVVGSIEQKEVTLTWALDNKADMITTYTATEHTVTAEAATNVGDETVNVTVDDGKQINAGNYTAMASGLTDGDGGGKASNYKLPENTSQSYTIAKSPVTFEVTGNSHIYDGTAKKVTLSNTNTSSAPVLQETSGYTVAYGEDNAASKTDVGNYDIHITLTESAAKNYKFADKGDEVTELTVEDSKLVISSASSTVTDVTITAADGELTYGDEFTVSANVIAPGEVTGKVTFSAGDVELGKADSHEGNIWTITVGADDKDKQHAIFDNKAITAEYSGDDNITGNNGAKENVAVAQKPLTYTVTGTGRVWDGKTEITVALSPTNTVTGDTVTLSAKGNLDDEGKAGTYDKVNLSEVTIDSDDERFYTTEKDRTGVDMTEEIEITKHDSSVKAPAGKDDLSYTGKPLQLIDAATEVDGGVVKYYVGTEAPTDGADGWKTAVSDITGTDVGEYTVWYYVDGDGNHNDTAATSFTVTIDPAKVSFTIGAEEKAAWPSDETNADPNPSGYALDGDNLTMTYDSYTHKANVAQTADEAVEIVAGATNGYTVTYKRVKDSAEEDVTEDAIAEIRDAGTYDVLVTINPTEGDVYNYVFDGEEGADHTLKIGTIAVKPYTVRVAWTHLKYVYHAHPMHPTLTVQNAFKSDLRTADGYPSGFDPENPDTYTGEEIVPFASTGESDVGEYDVRVKLYGKNAGNYTVEDDTETVTIVPAPVTFTVADNVWVIQEDGTLSRDTVTLKPAWGVVTVDPDVAVHDSYPAAGTAIRSDLQCKIEYRSGDVTYTEAPTEAGEYEVWVEIGNGNFRHTAGTDGKSHHVGELIVTANPESITSYTVTFDMGGYDGDDGPKSMTGVFANQTVVLPAVDVEWPYHIFQGWSYGGIIYLPNEEFHMPSSDVTFEAQWLDQTSIRNVGGIVKQQSGGDSVALYGATVTLKQGSNVISETSTDVEGKFSFENLVPGIYNLEVRYNDGSAEVVKTFLVDVQEQSLDEGEYILPDGALNTVVEADVTAVADLEDIVTADPSSEGIYTPTDAHTVSEGGTVEFKMSIKSTTLDGDKTEELPVSADQVGMTLNIELTKTVKTTGSTGTTEIKDAKKPITTIIHLPPELQGKSSYTVYRFHEAAGKKEVHTITTSRNENGEYIEVIREGTAIELHAQFYSTYVLAWNQVSGGYRVVLPARTDNGKLTSDRTYANRGRTVTLTATPDEGCHLRSLTVTDRSGNPVELTNNGDGTYSFVQPAGRVDVEAEFVKCLSRDYTDLDLDAWYHEYTDRVIESGLMLGVGDGLFEPDLTVTRAQMVTALWHMSGDKQVDYAMSYTDVSEDAWYAEAVRWASGEGVVGGYGDGKFGPNDPITREQMAQMLYRYEQNLGGGFTGEWMYRLPFTDLDEISDWASEAVAWCSMKEIVLGKDDGAFDPKGEARRTEMAAMLTRFCENTEK